MQAKIHNPSGGYASGKFERGKGEFEMQKRVLSFLLAFAMVLTLLPAGIITGANAEQEPVTYVFKSAHRTESAMTVDLYVKVTDAINVSSMQLAFGNAEVTLSGAVMADANLTAPTVESNIFVWGPNAEESIAVAANTEVKVATLTFAVASDVVLTDLASALTIDTDAESANRAALDTVEDSVVDGQDYYPAIAYEAEGACADHPDSVDCGHDDLNTIWTAWTSATTLPTTTGNYYLTQNVTVSTNGYSAAVSAAADIVLCMNGYNVTAAVINETKNPVGFYYLNHASANLVICDCTATGDPMIHEGAGKYDAGTFYVSGYGYRGPVRLVNGNATLTNVIIDGQNLDIINDVGAALVTENSSPATSSLKMYAGQITGFNGKQGAVRIQGATNSYFENVKFYNCTDIYNATSVSGTLVFPGTGAQTVKNCAFENLTFNAASAHTAPIAISNGTLDISGKIVLNNNTYNGASKDFVVSYNTAVTKIGAIAEGSNLRIATDATYSTNEAFAANPFVKAAADCAIPSGTVTYHNNGTTMGCVDGVLKLDYHVHEDGLEFAPISSEADAAAAGAKGGNYYLTQDIVVTDRSFYISKDFNLCLNGHDVIYAGSTAGTGRAITIGETGKTSADVQIFDCAAADLDEITDTEDYMNTVGKITCDYTKWPEAKGVNADVETYGGATSASGAAFFINQDSTLILHDGVITGFTTANAGSAQFGGTVTCGLANTTSFTMNGGIITGNKATVEHMSPAVVVREKTSFTMNGGYIYGNDAAQTTGEHTVGMKAAAVALVPANDKSAVNTAGVATINGGKIEAGENSIAIYADHNAVVNAADVTVVGDVYLTGNGAHTMENVTVEGGNVTVDNKLYTQANTAGTTNDGTATLTLSGTVKLDNGKVITVPSVLYVKKLAADSAFTFQSAGLEAPLTETVEINRADFIDASSVLQVAKGYEQTEWPLNAIKFNNNAATETANAYTVSYLTANGEKCFVLSNYHVHADGTVYEPLTNDTVIKANKNYYLAEDLMLDGAIVVNVPNVHFCLNGHDINAGNVDNDADTDDYRQYLAAIEAGTAAPVSGKLAACISVEQASGVKGDLTVEDCTAHYEGDEYVAGAITGGLGIKGVAVTVYTGTFTLKSGKIAKNVATLASKKITVNEQEQTVYYGSQDGVVGLYSAGSVVNIEGGMFEDNVTTGWGVIHVQNATATLNITGGTFRNNTAHGMGGVIYARNGISVENAVFENNSVDNKYPYITNAGVKQSEGSGGVIYLNDAAVAAGSTISNCTFTGNTAIANGGAINLQSAAEAGSIEITNCTFQNNTADFRGGAIWCGSRIDMDITGGAFNTNSAKNQGGAIYLQEQAAQSDFASSITGTSFTGNSANDNNGTTQTDMGGAISVAKNVKLNICEGTTFQQNSAGRQGGVFNISGGIVTLTGVSITNNSAPYTSVMNISGGADVTMDDCTVTGNTASNGYGAIYLPNNGSTLTVKGNTQIKDNLKGGAAHNIFLGYTANATTEATMKGYAAVELAELEETAQIGITLMDGRFTTVYEGVDLMHVANQPADTTYGHQLVSDIADYSFKIDGTRVILGHYHCLYGHHNCTNAEHGGLVAFTAWTKTDSLPTDGNYYLTKDVTLKAHTNVTTGLELILCLNGKTVNVAEDAAASTARHFRIADGKVTLTDCTAHMEGENYVSGKLTGGKTSSVYLYRNGGTHDSNLSVFNMYGGTITGNTSAVDGLAGAVQIQNGTFNMYGGKISGNTAKLGEGKTAANSRGHGGAISLYSWTTGGLTNPTAFNMHGGEISGNTAAKNDAGTIGGYGGGIYAFGANAKVTIYDGVIKNNTAQKGSTTTNGGGGGIYLEGSGAVLKTEGGKITGNSADMEGGAIRTLGGTHTIKDVEISGNTAGYGSAINLSNSATVTLDGATITANNATKDFGAVHAPNNSSHVKITGNTKVYGNTVNTVAANVFLRNVTTGQPIIELLDLGSEAEIYVYMAAARITADPVAATQPAGKSFARYLHSDNGSNSFGEDATDATKIILGHFHCVCGKHYCEDTTHGGVQAYTAWESTTALPTGSEGAGKYYYLTNNVKTTERVDVTSGAYTLCLNGKTVENTKAGERIFRVQAGELALTDCTGYVDPETKEYISGKITGGEVSGVALYGDGAPELAVFNMYGGTITGNTTNTSGGGVYLQKATFNMYGGKISNNSSVLGATQTINANYGHGGGVAAVSWGTFKAEFNMYGGEISGNTAQATTRNAGTETETVIGANGGGVYANGAGAALDIQGGVIKNNTAQKGVATVNGNGGGICATATATLSIADCEISGNTAAVNGGGVHTAVAATIEDTAITGNTATGNGGGIYNTAAMTVIGGKVNDNTAVNGGGACVTGANSEFDMSGGEISGNNAVAGGAIWAAQATVTLTDATITGNTATNASAVYAENFATVTIDDTSITGNNAKTGYGAVFAYPGSQLNLKNKVEIHSNTKAGNGEFNLYMRYVVDATRNNRLGYDPNVNDLGADSKIGVTFDATRAIDTYAAFTTPITAKGDFTRYFFSDSSDYSIYQLNRTEELAGDTEAKSRLYLAQAVYNNTPYSSMAAAAQAVTAEGKVFALDRDVPAQTFTADANVDLNGFDIAAVTVTSGNVNIKDTVTDDYASEDKDGNREYGVVGKITGTVNGGSAYAKQDGKWYVMITDAEEGTSFHRVYMSVTKRVLSAGRRGMGYTALYAADEKVASLVSEYGMAVGMEGTFVDQKYTVNAEFDYGICDGNPNKHTLVVTDVLESNGSTFDYASMSVQAKPYIKVGDTRISTETVSATTLQELVEYADTNYAKLSNLQKEQIHTMMTPYYEAAATAGWNLANFKAAQ